ncbi:hypothetical protein [Nocardioides sp.]|uniref:hypothetical protein n=1 Tax=Nocardioides sp. TaxID=35761 RepID=UPI00321B8A8C
MKLDDSGDAVEIRGLSLDEVTRAVRLLFAAERLQDQFEDYADTAVLMSMAEVKMPLVRSERAAATARTARLRQSLLRDREAWMTFTDLAALRDLKESSIRTWVTRKRDAGELFTVRADSHVVVPVLQLTSAGQLRTEIAALVSELSVAGVDGWSTWAWLTSPSEWLSGEVPAEVASVNPARAVRAARRQAAAIREGVEAHHRLIEHAALGRTSPDQ